MNDQQRQLNDLQDKITRLATDFAELSGQFYKNNFTSTQIFTKSSEFTIAVKLPVFTTLPTCEIGHLCVYQHDYGAGVKNNLMIGTATNTWTIVGTQS